MYHNVIMVFEATSSDRVVGQVDAVTHYSATERAQSLKPWEARLATSGGALTALDALNCALGLLFLGQ